MTAPAEINLALTSLILGRYSPRAGLSRRDAYRTGSV
jgi:hypothetical protein